ncbi:MAG: anti-sigma factor [Candidatus Binataceae bacterium]|nr:anti-sigma factor [Candidatus Binataceae bacterium]
MPPPVAPPWYRRVAFWRAVAGMAVAIALGCAAVAAEFSTELRTRTHRDHTRIRQLSANLIRMRDEVAATDRQLAVMRGAAAVHDRLGQLLAASDARLIRLAAPGHAMTAGGGVIALSGRLKGAAIELSGLPTPPADRVYQLWWTTDGRGALRAEPLYPDPTGQAATVLELPAPDETIAGAAVTLEAASAPSTPGGASASAGSVVRPSGAIELSGVAIAVRPPAAAPRHPSHPGSNS